MVLVLTTFGLLYSENLECTLHASINVHICLCVYIYIYIIYLHVCLSIYIYSCGELHILQKDVSLILHAHKKHNIAAVRHAHCHVVAVAVMHRYGIGV